MDKTRSAKKLHSRFIEHKQTGPLELRPLLQSDEDAFGSFLDGLGEHTRNMFGPHPLNSGEAEKICRGLDQSDDIRLILVNTGSTIIGYFIIYQRVRPSEMKRYSEVGIELSDDTDCTFAPCLSDSYQGLGIGRLVMPHIIDIVTSLGFKRMVLSGGTQSLNKAGRAFYRKAGFEEVRTFVTHHPTRGRIDNVDMMLDMENPTDNGR